MKFAIFVTLVGVALAGEYAKEEVKTTVTRQAAPVWAGGYNYNTWPWWNGYGNYGNYGAYGPSWWGNTYWGGWPNAGYHGGYYGDWWPTTYAAPVVTKVKTVATPVVHAEYVAPAVTYNTNPWINNYWGWNPHWNYYNYNAFYPTYRY